MRKLSLLVTVVMISAAVTFTNSSVASNSNHPWQITKQQFTSRTASYLSDISVLPGRNVKVFITCQARSYQVQLFRMGYYNGVGAKSLWQSSSHTCINQKKPNATGNGVAAIANWTQPVVIPTTSLPAGFYLVKIEAADNTASFSALTLRSISTDKKMVMVMPNMTSLAYNKWSGKNAYSGHGKFSGRARLLSFQLPNDWGYGSGLYLDYVHPLLMVADQMGLDLAFESDTDVASMPGLLHGASSYVSPGHDEYWTDKERRYVITARNQGTNLIFLGANVAYWRVRLETNNLEDSPLITIYKSAGEDPNKRTPTIRFRDVGLPESQLTGMVYRCFPAIGNFTPTATNSFVFKGTGFSIGSTFDSIIGPEIDTFTRPNSFIGSSEILAVSKVTCGRGKRVLSNAVSNMFYGISPSLAGTFSVGTMNWVVHGLSNMASASTRHFVLRVTRNVLKAAAEGPMGVANPIK
jgi:hypothetical protein